MSTRRDPVGAPVCRRARVGPADCALAVAIPLDPATFLRQAADPRHELVRGFIAQAHARHPELRGGPEVVWTHAYRPIAQHMEAMLDDVAACGVEVVRDASAAAIADLTARFGVVSIFGHAPFPRLRDVDLLDPSAIFLALTGQSPLANTPHTQRWLIEHLRGDPAFVLPQSESDLCACFARLTRTSEEFFCRYEVLPTPVSQNTLPGVAQVPWTAATLHEAFPNAIAPPAVVEMSDGLLGLDSLVNLVDKSFAGTLEFLACATWWFAEFFRRRRPACGDIVGTARTTDAPIRMGLYRAVIKLLRHSPMPYTDAVTAIHAAALRRTDSERIHNSLPHEPG